jgi:hypothetical protein
MDLSFDEFNALALCQSSALLVETKDHEQHTRISPISSISEELIAGVFRSFALALNQDLAVFGVYWQKIWSAFFAGGPLSFDYPQAFLK